MGFEEQEKQNNAINRLASGASISVVGKFIGRGTQAVTQIALARILGVEVFGLYAIGWSFLRISSVVAPLGLDQGIMRFGSRYWHADLRRFKGVLVQSIGLVILIGILSGIALYGAAPTLAQNVFEEPQLDVVLRWFAWTLPLAASLNVLTAATRISQRMRFSVLPEDLVQPSVNLILVVCFSLLGLWLWGVLAATLISFSLAVLMAGWYVWRLFSEAFRVKLKRPVFSWPLMMFSLPTALTSTFTILIIQIDRLLIGYFLSAVSVGTYQAAAQASILFIFTLNGINAIVTPMFADLYQKGEMRSLEEIYRVSTRWSIYLSFPIYIVLFFYPEEVLAVIFGPQYIAGATTLLILTTAQLINVGTGSVGFLLIMTGHQNDWFYISAVAFLINLALNWTLIPIWGLVGAALATGSAVIFRFLIGLWQIRRSLGIWPYDRRYVKGAIAVVVTVTAQLVLSRVDMTYPGLRLIMAASISYLAFFIVLYLFGLEAEDKELAKLFQRKFGMRVEGT